MTKKVEIIIKIRKNIKMVIVVIYRVKHVKVNKKKIIILKRIICNFFVAVFFVP